MAAMLAAAWFIPRSGAEPYWKYTALVFGLGVLGDSGQLEASVGRGGQKLGLARRGSRDSETAIEYAGDLYPVRSSRARPPECARIITAWILYSFLRSTRSAAILSLPVCRSPEAQA